MADIERLQTEMGDAAPDDPRHKLLDQVSRRTVALTRVLKLQTQIDSEDLQRQRKLEREARAVIDSGDDFDGLLVQSMTSIQVSPRSGDMISDEHTPEGPVAATNEAFLPSGRTLGVLGLDCDAASG